MLPKPFEYLREKFVTPVLCLMYANHSPSFCSKFSSGTLPWLRSVSRDVQSQDALLSNESVLNSFIVTDGCGLNTLVTLDVPCTP